MGNRGDEEVVVKFLTGLVTDNRMAQTDEAKAAHLLLSAITHKAKTLADYGTITYQRKFRSSNASGAVRTDVTAPDGVMIDDNVVPWPDDYGICDLLYDGFRLVTRNHLEESGVAWVAPATSTPVTLTFGMMDCWPLHALIFAKRKDTDG